MINITIARNSIIRSKFGGYGRIIEDGVVKNSVYVKKNTVFRISTFNLFTQSVVAIEEATGRALSLEYDYILNCEIVSNDKQTVINGMTVIDTAEDKKDYNNLCIILNVVLSAVCCLLLLILLVVKF